MALSIIRLGTPRTGGELRIGTVRRPPRGVRREDFARLGYYDVWLPLLSPSEPLVKEWLHGTGDEKALARFRRKFREELQKSGAMHVIEMLAALSQKADIAVGCYCQEERTCHRAVLRELLSEHGAKLGRNVPAEANVQGGKL